VEAEKSESELHWRVTLEKMGVAEVSTEVWMRMLWGWELELEVEREKVVDIIERPRKSSATRSGGPDMPIFEVNVEDVMEILWLRDFR
jgi:hypothetical protein